MRATAAFVLVLLLPPAAALWPATHPACGGAPVVLDLATGQGVLENLLVDAEGVYVTGDAKLRRYAHDGTLLWTLDGPGGGLALGPDGALYAGVGNAAAASLQKSGASAVWRIDRATLAHEVYASGFDMANGLVFDGAGNLYVSNDFGESVVRVAPGGAWTAWADVYGANGMAVLDGELYAAVTFDQRSPIVAVSLADPAQQRVVAETTFGAASLRPALVGPSSPAAPVVPKGLDDMTLGADGRLYAAANAAGEVLRVEPATGAACVVASGLPTISSVRFTPDGERLYATTFTGRLVVMAVPA